jgi:predicted branched-subunit amino acid permease
VFATTTARAAFWQGVRELLPLAPGLIAWGLVTGFAMLESGLSVDEALGMTLLTYAGTAQLAALPLIAAAAPASIVFATALVVNLRFVIYSLALRSLFAGRGATVRLGLGYLTGDVGFVKMMGRLDREPTLAYPLVYFAGLSAASWVAWQVGSIAGVLGARYLPAHSGLELAGTLALVTLLVPLCARLPALAGVLVAGIVSVVGARWPLKLGILAAVLIGIAVAVALEWRLARAAAAAHTPGRGA